MGKVAVTISVSLDGPEADADGISSKIRKIGGVREVRATDIGFGLKKLEVLAVFDDKHGGNTDKLEEKIRSIDGVANTETGDATLI